MSNWSEQRKAAVDAVMKRTINQAAVHVLRETGVENITMDRVAAEAGVAKGTIYNYFSSKEELLAAIYEHLMQPIKDRVEEIAGSPVSADQKLKAIIFESIRFCEENRSTLALFQKSAYSPKEDWGEREGFVGLLEDLIEAGVVEKVFRPQNARRSAEMLLGVIIGFFEFRIHRDESVDVDAEFNEIWNFFFRALAR
ncbi:MAG: TetR/AcrR family transcriptional regulator [Acidobacteriota bacterium]|nr:MAG: TetR/AcrR family transcriptional regulator [Acidobacteriota bacterium]